MTYLLSKKNLWTLVFGGLFALLLLPTDSFAQSRKVAKRSGNDVYTKAKANRTTAKRTYNNTARRTTSTAQRPTSSTRRTYTKTTRSKAATNSRTLSTNRARGTAQNRASSQATNANRRTRRAVDTAPRRATSATIPASNARVNNNRAERNAASSFNYTANERNDYCNNYYRGINNWNRTFWLSNHYTPSYYDLSYSRFPFRNGVQSQRFRYMGQRLWFYDGIWFKKRFGRYYAIDAPIGLCVDSLPIGGEMIWYRGDKYVIYRGTAYRMLPFGGFQVVQMLTRF